jgi:hypothetical protein
MKLLTLAVLLAGLGFASSAEATGRFSQTSPFWRVNGEYICSTVWSGDCGPGNVASNGGTCTSTTQCGYTMGYYANVAGGDMLFYDGSESTAALIVRTIFGAGAKTHVALAESQWGVLHQDSQISACSGCDGLPQLQFGINGVKPNAYAFTAMLPGTVEQRVDHNGIRMKNGGIRVRPILATDASSFVSKGRVDAKLAGTYGYVPKYYSVSGFTVLRAKSTCSQWVNDVLTLTRIEGSAHVCMTTAQVAPVIAAVWDVVLQATWDQQAELG